MRLRKSERLERISLNETVTAMDSKLRYFSLDDDLKVSIEKRFNETLKEAEAKSKIRYEQED